ncbi:MAG: LPS export ABC transporter permease LptF [Roseovarius sp.]
MRVTRFDRYLLSQFMVLFGFFALVLVSIFWINKAVRMFDRLVGDGQPAWVFAEFTALTLPGVIGVVLPLATFAAAVQVTNRMVNESELVVVQATGYSPWRLIRAAAVFGVIIALIMSLLSHVLIPLSLAQLRQRQFEVIQSVSARFLEEGEFLHPAPGITFYIREITPEGTLRDVFLSDRRDPESPVIYTSSQAYLVQEDGGTRLVMVKGLAQNLRADGKRLFTTHFDDFTYDISRLISANPASLKLVEFASTADLLLRPEQVARETGATAGEVQYRLHARFSQALMCVIAALIGFATLLLGSFSRFGIWWQVLAAFLLLVGIKLIEGAATGMVLANAAAWPAMYLPALSGLLLVTGLLHAAARPDLWHPWRRPGGWRRQGRRRRPAGGEA